MCSTDPDENNYEEYIQYDDTRRAIHVGDRPFGTQSGDVYNSMIDDFMRSERENVEFLLDRYKVKKWGTKFSDYKEFNLCLSLSS